MCVLNTMLNKFYDDMKHDQDTINSSAPGKSECDSKNGIFYLVLLIGNDNTLWWMPQELTDDKQSGTKPNLVAKILATNFGVFL